MYPFILQTVVLLFVLLVTPSDSWLVPIHQCIGSRHPTTRRQSAFPRLGGKATDKDDDDARWEKKTLERKIQRLTNLLTQQERQATQDRMDWMSERAALGKKVSSLRSLLKEARPLPPAAPPADESSLEAADTIQALERELHVAHEHEDDLLHEQDRLEREVVILQDQIVQIRNMLKTQEYRTAEAEEQLDGIQEHYEAATMQLEVKVEAQAREIEVLRSHLQWMEQHQPVVSSVTNGSTISNNGMISSSSNGRNETMAASLASSS